MQNDNTHLLPNQEADKQKNHATADTSKAIYGAGGFVAGMGVGAAASASASSPDKATANEADINSATLQTDSSAVEPISSQSAPETDYSTQQNMADAHRDYLYSVQHAPDPHDVIIATSEGIRVAQVDDADSFAQAFAEARMQVGAGGVFEWRGDVYSTYYKQEWNAMSATEKADFNTKIDYAAVSDGFAPDAMAHHPISSSSSSADITTGADTDDIKVLGVDVVEVGDGNMMGVAGLDINGHRALMVDVDMDGTMDGFIMDVNQNGEIEEHEIQNIEDYDIAITDLAQASTQQQMPDQSFMPTETPLDAQPDVDADAMFLI